MVSQVLSPGGGSKKVTLWGILCHKASPIFDPKWRQAPLDRTQLRIYPEIVARICRSSSRSLAVLAAVSNAEVAGSNQRAVSVMLVFAKPIS